MVRASASQSVDLGYIPLVESYQKPLKNCIHSFPAWRSTFREVVENKQASLLVSLGKTLNETPSPICGRQVAQLSLRRELVAERASDRKTNAML